MIELVDLLRTCSLFFGILGGTFRLLLPGNGGTKPGIGGAPDGTGGAFILGIAGADVLLFEIDDVLFKGLEDGTDGCDVDRVGTLGALGAFTVEVLFVSTCLFNFGIPLANNPPI